MSLIWVGYAVVVAVLLGAAAHGAESALRRSGRSGRWAWTGALVGSWLLPLAVLLRPPTAGGGEPVVMTLTAVEMPAGTPAPGAWDRFVGWLSSLPDLVLEVAGGLVSAFPAPFVAVERWGALAWSVSAALCIAALAAAVWHLGRRSRSWPESRVLDEPVRVSPEFGPAVLGVVRPRIVLPRWALDLGEEALRLIVEHEREHRRAGDTLLLTLGGLAVLAAPWNPALWWQLRRLRLAVEMDCDQRVLRGGARPAEYGALLLEMGERASAVRLPAAALAERSSFLERRLRVITAPARRGSPWGIAGGVLLAAALVVAACETPAPTELERPVPSETAGAIVEAEGKGAANATFRVRGLPRIGVGEAPLVVIDGEVATQEALAALDVDRIDRVEVVKGDAARAVWGERGRNGVVHVWTVEAAEEAAVIEERDATVRATGTAAGRWSYRAAGGDTIRGTENGITVRADTIRATYEAAEKDAVYRIREQLEARSEGGSGVLRARGVPAVDGLGSAAAGGVAELRPQVVFVDGERWTGTGAELRALEIEKVEVLAGPDARSYLEERGVEAREETRVVRVTTGG